MSDREKGFYYARYRREMKRQQMLLQKICGIIFAVIGILLQFAVGFAEFFIASVWVIGMGLYMVLTQKLYI